MRQKYTTENVFPVRCYSFKAPEELNNQALEVTRKQEYRNFNLDWDGRGGVGTTDDIQTDPEFRPLMQWFQQCIDTLHFDNGWCCDRIMVNKAWCNRADPCSGHHHDAHRHPMSWLSGIYYMTPGAPTIFLDPIDRREWASLHLDGGPGAECRWHYHGGPGGLIIFPSWLIHASLANNDDVQRFTIAFNTFPQGDINMGGWQRPMVNVPKVRGWDILGPLPLRDYKK
tara:strand:+ start:4612 stop:5292 length:681 start_codon:yes stop_codon:yes gene_type:complete